MKTFPTAQKRNNGPDNLCRSEGLASGCPELILCEATDELRFGQSILGIGSRRSLQSWSSSFSLLKAGDFTSEQAEA
jgi:hypothetical protein